MFSTTAINIVWLNCKDAGGEGTIRIITCDGVQITTIYNELN